MGESVKEKLARLAEEYFMKYGETPFSIEDQMSDEEMVKHLEHYIHLGRPYDPYRDDDVPEDAKL